MQKIRFERAGVEITRTGFGALPIQRISMEDAGAILRRAYEGGITFFDTARAYTDSEQKMGEALADVRDQIIIATKTGAKDAEGFWYDLETSLTNLKTDHIDIYQFHNPGFVPVPGGEDGLYDAALEAKRQSKIRAIGITQHTLALAKEAIESGLYDTLQYPFNHLASEEEIQLVERCEQLGIGFIAMKALSGGLVTDARAPFAFIRQYENVVPIWGIQHMHELDQILSFEQDPPMLTDLQEQIARDQKELSGSFCRCCGYCLPCPVGIPIHNANRMKQLITRAPSEPYLSEDWQQQMAKIEQCTRCGLCAQRCPYGLKPYETLPGHLAFYRELLGSQ
ncbi:aldo/keto reductase [Eubacteriales bacterium OttesenSCG-928-N13]|nr:aldo/keto reductase [Eubacteriales bacterium OttesenSCG-928-N13]